MPNPPRRRAKRPAKKTKPVHITRSSSTDAAAGITKARKGKAAKAKPTKSKPNFTKNLQSVIRRAENALTELGSVLMPPGTSLKEKKAKKRASQRTAKARRARATKPKPATAKAQSKPATRRTHSYKRP